MKYKFIVILVLSISLLLTACNDEGNKPNISVEPVPSNTVINDGEKPGGIDNKLLPENSFP